MKKLLICVLWSFSANSMTDKGTIGSDKVETPNEVIYRLNGSGCPLDRLPQCPYNCKNYYIAMMVDSIKNLIVDLYNDNLIDLETMENQLKALQTERTAEIFKEILEHIQKLKDE